MYSTKYLITLRELQEPLRFFCYCFFLIAFTSCRKEITKGQTSSSVIKYFNGDLNDKVKKVEKTSDGGFIYCGSTIKSGNFFDAFLLKVDANGHQEWYRTYGGERDDWFNHVIQTSDGGYMAVGVSNSIGEGTKDSTFRRLDYVVKLNSAGDEEWTQSYSSSNPFDIELNYVVESPDHFFYSAGAAYGNSFTGYNTLLLKWDNKGKLRFIKQFSSFSNYPPKLIKDPWEEIGVTVSIDQNGSVIIGGIMNPSSDYSQNDNFVTFLMSANSLGVVNFYYPYYDFVRGFNYYRNSNYKNSQVKVLCVVDGYLIGTYLELPDSKMVFQLIKTDLSGSIIWEKKYHGLGNTIMTDMQLLNDGEILMTGASSPNEMSFSLPELFDNFKSTIIKLDRDGNILWNSYIGEDNNATIAHSVQSTSDGGLILAGHTCLSETGYDKMCWMKLDKYGKLVYTQ